MVVPCFNEEECVEVAVKTLMAKMDELTKGRKISRRSGVVLVDDGSKDGTWGKIEGLIGKHVVGVKLARNVGHQNALMAGLEFAVAKSGKTDAVVSIDADLQDDVEVIGEMVEKFQGGAEIVYGVRKDRKTDTGFKRVSAGVFYGMMRFLGVEMTPNAADFRLMSRRAVEELMRFGEVNLFLRGMVPLIGLSTAEVYYTRKKRMAGESKYPLGKMLHFAWDGVTSFSVRPIRMVFAIGLIIFLLAGVVTAYAIIQKLTGNTVSGWTFTVCSLWTLGGLQMVAIGLIGEYVGKMYAETKRRPRWVVEKVAKK